MGGSGARGDRHGRGALDAAARAPCETCTRASGERQQASGPRCSISVLPLQLRRPVNEHATNNTDNNMRESCENHARITPYITHPSSPTHDCQFMYGFDNRGFVHFTKLLLSLQALHRGHTLVSVRLRRELRAADAVRLSDFDSDL
eukprot:scaffold28522_cov101-Isochrysis_galbana.AAC.1